ncbi:MAG: hypothetical protein PHC64_07695 [Candidatus Gastranaerophilales bacterium]|nr:hypothetical protein [Candidatus Gastranaerophilales bacterium]
MYKYSKLTLKIFFIIITIAFSLFIAVAYIYDPLQIWHKPYFREVTYADSTREALKAIIRDNNFDGIIIGSSISTNTSAKQASQNLNSVFINLSADGSVVPENRILLNYALKQKKIKKVIYFIGIYYLGLKKENSNYPVKNYSFLYDDNIYNDYKIYLNEKYIKCIITLSNNQKCIGKKLNMDKPYSWVNIEEHMIRFGGFDNWIQNKDNWQIENSFNDLIKTPKKFYSPKVSTKEQREITDYLDKNILSVIEKNPKTQFYLILSPVSSLELAREIRTSDNQNFERQKTALKYLISENKKYTNLKIFAFDNLDNMGHIEDFKDLIHFHPRVNAYILNAIRDNRNILTSENVDEYIRQTYKKTSSYDFDYYVKKINEVNR